MLTAQKDQTSALYLSAARGESDAALTNISGVPELSLHDANGIGRLVVKLREGAEPSLWMGDKDAKARVVAGVNNDGWGGLGIIDPKGNVRGDFSLARR